MHIEWMTSYISYAVGLHSGYAARARLLGLGVIVFAVAVRGLARSIRRWRRIGYGRRKPVLRQPRGPSRPGPIFISKMKLRLSLVYERGPRRPRPVTLYAARGRREASGEIALDLLHTFCHTLYKPRTFRVDRILTATDADGAAIPDLSAWVLAESDMRESNG